MLFTPEAMQLLNDKDYFAFDEAVALYRVGIHYRYLVKHDRRWHEGVQAWRDYERVEKALVAMDWNRIDAHVRADRIRQLIKTGLEDLFRRDRLKRLGKKASDIKSGA